MSWDRSGRRAGIRGVGDGRCGSATLGLESSFPGAKSWRFIPEDHIFVDPQNPFLGGFPEFQIVSNLNEATLLVGMHAVKLGDVNFSANPLL